MFTARTFTTRAPFHIAGRWQWVRWTHDAPKHAAVLAKMAELQADAADVGQADHYLTREYPFATR